jgi:hypothetical protein
MHMSNFLTDKKNQKNKGDVTFATDEFKESTLFANSTWTHDVNLFCK